MTFWLAIVALVFAGTTNSRALLLLAVFLVMAHLGAASAGFVGGYALGIAVAVLAMAYKLTRAGLEPGDLADFLERGKK